jgi:hypothetical protein
VDVLFLDILLVRMPVFLLANLNQRMNTYRILSAEHGGGLYRPVLAVTIADAQMMVQIGF